VTTTLDAGLLEELEYWLAQQTAVSERLRENAAAAAEAAWAGFDSWYDTAAVTALGAELASLSTSAQQTTTGAVALYVDTVVGLISGTAQTLSTPPVPEIRGGVDLKLVHTRPAEAFKQAIATGSPEDKALDLAVNRGANLMRTDVALTERVATTRRYQQTGTKRYRRIVRPELSESGSCGLCIAASTRIYKVSQLMPIHPPWCKCRSMPLAGDVDPGALINEADLDALYAAAGSTAAADLTGVRVKVNQHGELGPVLSRAGDEFRSKAKVALEDDPDRAARMLVHVLPTLQRLEERAAAGEDVAGPLTYQRALAARLRRITGS
jgi:hypothetical protein